MKKYEKGKGNRWKDLNGKIFGKWTVLGYKGNKMWECKCECGTIKDVLSGSLLNNRSKSCGCYIKELQTTHNSSYTKEYNIWQHMKARCHLESNSMYHHYGGRGIKVCDEWLESFDNFIQDMGLRPSRKHSLERIDNNGNYCKDNCKWATVVEQCNNRRTNRFIEYDGLTLTLIQHIRRLDLPEETIRSRLKIGWTVERAFSTPIKKYNKKIPVTK